jgi:hypothetical protein
MSKKLFLSLLLIFWAAISATQSNAQTSRKVVGGAEVTGTFRSYYSGKYKSSYSEIKILALGKGKIKVSFELTYPFVDGTGAMSANLGSGEGEAEISGDTAVYKNSESGQCTITIKFVKPGQIKVTQSGSDAECGFGFNVTADGTYKKVSGAKPKFENNN